MAFDTINHNLLLAKMKAYGLSQNALNVIQSMVKDRPHRVKINGITSDWDFSYIGIPQGSKLGPLIFNIFVQDIVFILDKCGKELYADDTTIYVRDNNPMVLEHKVNLLLEKMNKWYRENKLTLNPLKTQMMVLGNSFKYSFRITLDGVIVSELDCLKILGVYIDNKLTYKQHIAHVKKSINLKLMALRRVRRFLTEDILVKMYQMFIIPYFDYCSLLFLGIGKSERKKLEKLNHHCIKSLFKLSKTTNYDVCLCKVQVSTLEETRCNRAAIMIFNMFNNRVPNYIKDMFPLRTGVYNLRMNGKKIEHVRPRTHILANSFKCLSIKIWEKCYYLTFDIVSVKAFKKRLKNVNLTNDNTCNCFICN